MSPLENQVAVVTGAGRGIGECIAMTLAAQGAKVAVISRTEANAAKSAEAINAIHPNKAHAYALDVGDFNACQQIGKTISTELGPVDIVVNNAGITRDGLFMRMKEEDWDAVIAANLKGAFNIIKAFQKNLLKSQAGRIINISSVCALTGNAGQTNYAASKAGLIGFTKSLAREFAPRKVTANCVAPGFIVTDMTGKLTQGIQDQVKTQIPLGEFGAVEDIAAAVAFLAGSSGRYITGQVLTVDGGMVM